jgi:hypothetical protein
MSARRPLRSLGALSLAALTSLAIIAAAGPTTAGATGPGCDDLTACLWGQPDFMGVKITANPCAYYAGSWWPLSSNYNSAKNRCNGRKLKLGRYTSPTTIDVTACLDPGDNRPDPGWFDAFHVGDAGAPACS